MSRTSRCSIVPPYLLRQLATTTPAEADRWERMLAVDADLRLRRATGPVLPARQGLAPVGPDFVVHTAANTSTLPGRVVRTAGDPASGDLAVDEAADGIAAALALYAEVWDRDSYDDAGVTVSTSVHFERGYANAFWDGSQLVFGDGDGTVFDRMTKAVDVLAHELAHAVTERTAGLVYEGQSGALNESMSDVVGSCLKQRLLGQDAGEGDWLIGAGLFLPGVRARGLRDMAAPGTAYDDPALGRDPQPAHLDDYVDTPDDNGGVHLNSGIPNRAFHLAATAIGGSAAQGAGRIWYAVLTGDLDARADFATFAAATVAAAGEHADVVSGAWTSGGVMPGQPRRADRGGVAHLPAGQGVVSVHRTGGFAGLAADGFLDLQSTDERVSEVQSLVERVDLRAVPGGTPRPDMYLYDFDLCGDCKAVPEHQLTPDLRRVADLLLGGPPPPPG
ncbi:MAG: M4 family metallopeptidase [Nocardioides sp.]|nr:M4 family metallopeptidase [Nocardioides sp.]